MTKIRPALWVNSLCMCMPLFLSACAGLAARGVVGGQAVQTRVDSEAARYYVMSYLSGKRSDPVLDAQIDQVYRTMDGRLPDQEDLKALSVRFSSDFAALFFAESISRMSLNHRFRSVYDEAYAYARNALPKGRVQLPESAAHYEALIVPSYLHNRANFSGADLAAPRRALEKIGFPCHFVETSDDGPIESNAEIVVDAIRARASSGRRLIIISASKSGPEVALALTQLGPAGTRHVAAWINAVRALRGTALIDDKVLPELEFFVGKVDPAGVESMKISRSRQRFESFRISKDILVVNFFGIPVSGSVGLRARRGFFPLQKYGPNDGMVLLADMIYPGGITLTEIGSDHFLMDQHLDITTVALTMSVMRWLADGSPRSEPPGALLSGNK